MEGVGPQTQRSNCTFQNAPKSFLTKLFITLKKYMQTFNVLEDSDPWATDPSIRYHEPGGSPGPLGSFGPEDSDLQRQIRAHSKTNPC